MKSLLVLPLMLFSITVFASDKGNGGNTVVCKNPQGDITSIEVFDLYEGRVLKGLTYTESDVPAFKQALAMAEKIVKAAGDESFHEKLVIAYNNFNFLPSGTGLKPVDDGAEIIVPKGCEVVQTANRINDDNIYVDTDIWEKMSETQKAALIVHEAVYFYFQQSVVDGKPVETNSVRTRKLVAYLFSGEKLKPVNQSNVLAEGEVLSCQTDQESSMFNVYKTGPQSLNVEFSSWDNRRIVTSSSMTLQLGQLQNWPASRQSPLTVSGMLNSPVDDHVKAFVHFESSRSGAVWFVVNGSVKAKESFHCELQGNVPKPPQHPSVQGCYEYLDTEFEDGASIYKYIEERILAPLRKDENHTEYARFLEQWFVTYGYGQIDHSMCKNIENRVNQN